VCNHTLNANVSDRTALLIDAQPFYYQTQFTDLVTVTSEIKHHIVNDYYTSYSYGSGKYFAEDELVSFSSFEINPSYLGNGNLLQVVRMGVKIYIRNIFNNNEFLIEQYSTNVANTPYVGDLQYFNIDTNSALHIPSTEIRKHIITRYNSTTGKYEFAYPYLNRWEYWEALQGVISFFFNTAQPNNGFNHDWAHYMLEGWQVEVRPFITVKYNGYPATYEGLNYYTLLDRNIELVGTCDIKTYDPDTLTELVNGGTSYILGYKNTLIEATFNGFTGTTSTKNVVLGIEIKELGGRNGKYRMSSLYNPDSDTWFLPLSGETKVKLDFPSAGVIVATALIDFSKLDLTKLDYKLTARLYEQIV